MVRRAHFQSRLSGRQIACANTSENWALIGPLATANLTSPYGLG